MHMQTIDKSYLNKTIDFMEVIYKEFSNKNIFSDNAKIIKMFSGNNFIVENQCLTSFLRINNYTIPKLFSNRNSFSNDYIEYFFDDNKTLLQKRVHLNCQENVGYDFFYSRNKGHMIRLKYKYNNLIEIHYCFILNNKLIRIDNAHWDLFGNLHYISGELYEYINQKISRCINYSEFFPKSQIFKKITLDNKIIVTNPVITEYNLIYNHNNELYQYKYTVSDTDKYYYVKKVPSIYYDRINKFNNVEPIILW